MDESLLRALQERRPEIRARWEALLRIERVETPLANPDTLVYLFDQTLDEVLAALPVKPAGPVRIRPKCRCECNPMRAYFPALEQALLETLVLVQTELPALNARARVGAVTELCAALRRIAERELAVFDQICRRRPRRQRRAGSEAEYTI
jgi:hypothetical protein